MTDEHKLGSGDGPTIVTFAQFERARGSKAADEIDETFRDVLNDLKMTVDSLDALPRSTAFEPDREKLVMTCIAATREISHLRTQPMGNELRFVEICEEQSARIASFIRRFELSMPDTL